MQSEFENLAREKPWFKPERDGKERDDTEFVYSDFVTDMAWLSWQEARKVNTDLLEALQFMLMNANGRDLSQDESDALDLAINMAESAIKKATTIQQLVYNPD